MTSLMPPPNRSVPPPFHLLDADTFEELCCALMDKETGVRTAERYRAPRQLQFGIDVLGRRSDHGVDVVSCKCYGEVRKGQITQWCNDFLDHWDAHWRPHQVRRFILVVAADVRSRQRQEEIDEQRGKFEKIGVELVVWGPRQLQEKLRPHYGIAAQHLGEPIADQICGRQQLAIAQPVLDAIVTSQLSRLQSVLAAELDRRLDHARDALKRGNGAAMDRALDEIQSDPDRWAALGPDGKARVLRLRGSRALERGEAEQAQKLADEADRLAGPAEGRRLRAAVAARRGDPVAGLRLLGDPVSMDDRRVAGSLLLAARQPRLAFEALPEGDAEDAALRAIALAAMSELDAALAEVERAESLDPDLLVVRRAGVAVRFALAMSPVVPFEAGPWPEPTPLGLVREDDPARELLRAAADLAAAALRGPGLDRDDSHDFETWRLACLASQRDQSPEAEAYARDLLGGGRSHPGAVIWSLARGYDFDRPRAARGLEDLLASGRGETMHLTVLLALQLEMGRPDRAERALRRHRGRFAIGPAAELLAGWGKIVGAHREGGPVPPDVPTPLRLQRLVEDAKRSGRWEAVESFAREAAQGKHALAPGLAFEGLRLLSAASRWESILRFVPFLVDRVRTAEAMTLACLASFHAGGPAPALELLDANANAFPNGALPLRLRRLRVECLRGLGRLSEATQLADVLALGGETPDLVAAIEVRLAAGDVAAAVPYFRSAAERDDLPPERALRYARAARIADPAAASDLWRRALAAGVPERLAGAAASVAFELGMDTEAGPLLAKFAARAEAGDDSIRVATLQDVVDVLRQRREHAEQAYAKYLAGEIPLHLLVDALGDSLADFVARAFAGQSGPILIGDGSRRRDAPREEPIATWRLRLDVTGLLTAHHLSLLDLLERHLAPLELPNALPGALREMSLQLGPRQPSQLQAQRALIAAVGCGRVTAQPLDSLTEPARVVAERGGILVDYTPGPEDHEPRHRSPFANPRWVLDAVAAAGAASDEVMARGRRGLGSMALEAPLGPEPRPGQELAFAGNTLQVFAAADLLDALAATFRVVVDADWLRLARDEVAEAERRERVAADIDRLGDRLAAGLRRGTYTLLPEPRRPNNAGEAGAPRGPALECLFDLIRSPPEPASVIWADDRFLTRFPEMEHDGRNVPLVGVGEVLEALRAGGLLDDGAYFDRLRRLREAGAQFLLPLPNEVLHHLDRAAMQDGELVETPGLRALRRSFAASALLEDQLRLDLSDGRIDGRTDEARILRDLWRLPATVLGALWRREADPERTRASADWVYGNIVVDRLKRAPLDGAEASRQHLHAFHLAGLVLDVLQISGPDSDAETTRRQAFLGWLDQRVLEPRLTADPALAQEIATHLKELLLRVLGTDDALDADPEREAFTRAWLARFVLLLPERLARPLVDDPEVSSMVQVARRPSIEIGGLVLPADAFFAAAAEAIENGSAEVQTPAGTLLRLGWENSGAPTLLLSEALAGRFEDPGLDLLQADPATRRACLDRHPEWIDRPPLDAERRRADIVGRAAPHERMLSLDDERAASAEYCYQQLAEALATPGERVPASLFEPPAVDNLLRHLRLENDEGVAFPELLDRAAQHLLDEFGLVGALSRLAGLPVPTPAALRNSLLELGQLEGLSLLNSLGAQSASPVRQARIVELLRIHGAQSDRVAAGFDYLLADVEVRLEGLLALLRWTERRLERQIRWQELPQPLQLAAIWAHADRVADVLLAATEQLDKVAPTIDGWHPRGLVPWLLRDPADEGDPASSSVASPPALLLGLLGLAVGNDENVSLSDRQRDLVLACVSNRGSDGGLWPYAQLLWADEGPDALGSILGGDCPRLRALLDVDGLGERLGPRFAHEIAEQAFEALAHDQDDVGAWKLLLVVRRNRIAPAERERAANLLRRLDLRAIAAADEQTAIAVAQWSARIGRLLDDEAVDAAVLMQLVALASRTRERTGEVVRSSSSGESEADIAHHISDAAAQLSRGPTAARVAERLAQAARALAATSPEAARLWREILERLVSEFAYTEAAALW